MFLSLKINLWNGQKLPFHFLSPCHKIWTKRVTFRVLHNLFTVDTYFFFDDLI